MRVEDADRSRVRPGMEALTLGELRWLGLDWDEGPDVGGSRGPYRQSERLGRYAAALARLAAAGLDAGPALAAIDEPVYLARVDAMGDEARRAGVTGIPTMLVGRRRVVGCQRYEVFAAAVEAEGAARRA